MTEPEKAYIAGLIDSRCYIGWRSRGIRMEQELEMCRELPVLMRVKSLIGGSVMPYKHGYRLRLRGAGVQMVLDAVRPYALTELGKVTQAEIPRETEVVPGKNEFF